MYIIFVKVGFKNDGTIQALEVKVYANAGNSFDLSGPVSIYYN